MEVGKGMQFRVLDHGDRVRKALLSDSQALLQACKQEPYRVLIPWTLRDRVADLRAAARQSLEEFDRRVERRDLFANASVDGVEYSQDFVATFSHVFRNSDAQQREELLSGYAQLRLALWCVGVHDTVFNFLVDTGVDDQDRLVLLDLGELAFSKRAALSDVRSQRWLSAASAWLLRAFPSAFAHYKQVMADTLTRENLEEYWRSGRVDEVWSADAR